VGQLQEASNAGPRYVLLAVPAHTPLAPLVERLLLPQGNSTALWQSVGMHELRLSQALPQL
jgi:membrane protein